MLVIIVFIVPVTTSLILFFRDTQKTEQIIKELSRENITSSSQLEKLISIEDLDTFFEILAAYTPLFPIIERIRAGLRLCSSVVISSSISLLSFICLIYFTNCFLDSLKTLTIIICMFLSITIASFHFLARKMAANYWRYISISCLMYFDVSKNKNYQGSAVE